MLLSFSPSTQIEFADGTTKYYCKIYYAEHFRLLRKLIFPQGEDTFVRSLSRSQLVISQRHRQELLLIVHQLVQLHLQRESFVD